MPEKTKITEEGLKKLKEEYRELVDRVGAEVKTQIAEARAQGDLSENADYDAARNKQGEVEARIKEIEYILDNYELIKENPKDTNKITLGKTVKITFLDTNTEATYKIVGTIESDPFKNLISNDSPLGTALIGRSKGDIVEIKAKKNYTIRVEEITVK